MLYISQRDARWSQDKIGASNITLGRYGCTTSCISMLSQFVGPVVLPNSLASHTDLFTKDGLIIWQNIQKYIPNLKFVSRLRYYNRGAVEDSLKTPGRFVILEVANRSHWVLPTHKTFFGGDYVVADPWAGKAMTAFGDFKNITGSAHFIKA